MFLLSYTVGTQWPYESKLVKSTVVVFIMLYKVALVFESVDEILKCDHSNESC